ncbi:MAG: efflux RND transporter permease subunit [Mollicutes bacterium]|nr:efflux RND transporter permease subunit [Mollicutes bacterium]
MSKYSVKKPVTILMCIMIVIVLGIYSLTKQSLGLFPEMNLPYVVVVTPYVGASAEEVTEKVTSVVESQVTSMNNFSSVQSTSSSNYSVVIVEFNDGTNMDTVMIDLRTKLDNIEFPEGTTKPTILKVSPDMLPVMTVSVSMENDEIDPEQSFIKTTQFVENELITRLNRVEGVAEVSMSGASSIVVEVNLDQNILKAKGYTNDEILSLIKEQNHDELIGIALNNGKICMLNLGNSIENIDDLKELPLPLSKTNEVVRLKDLAAENGIKYTDQNSESYSKVNGKKTITLSFQMQNGSVITDITKAITKELDNLKKEYSTFDYSVVLDQGEYINMAVSSVVENLIYGAILAVAILLLFLRDWRPTLIVGLAIPISVIATFMCMYFAGINLNMLSMGGLAIGIGMLVDNAIVVIENIFRLRKEGKSKKEAAIQGAKGVASAIISSTVTTIIVFVPVLFLGGTVKDVFSNMAYTITFSLLCSLVISLTMVPSMASRMFNDPNHCPKCDAEISPTDTICSCCGKKLKKYKEPKVKNKESKFMATYDKVIRWTLSHKLIVFGSVVLLFILSVGLVVSKGFVLLPATDEGSISTTIAVNSDIPFDKLSNYTDDLAKTIKDSSNEIETVSARFGNSSGMMALISSSSSNVTSISLTIKLKDNHRKATDYYANNIKDIITKHNSTENLKQYEIKKSDIYESETESSSSSITSFTSSGVSIRVKGYNLEKMEEVAVKLAQIMSEVEGTKKVSTGVVGSDNNLKIYVNKENAAKVGLTEQDFIDNARVIFNTTGLDSMTTENTTKLVFNGNEYELSIPSEVNIAGIGLTTIMKLFGSYEEFLKYFKVFDKKMLKVIEDSGLSVYTFMPTEFAGMTMTSIMLIIQTKYGGDFTKAMTEAMKEGISLVVSPFIYYSESENKLYDGTKLGITLPSDAVPLDSKAAGNVLGSEDDDDAISYVKKVTGYSTILSDGKYRYFNVTCRVNQAYNVTKVSSEVNKRIDEYINSSEFDAYRDIVQIEYKGENEQIMDTVKQMIIALLIGILLVYMVMAIQFQSLVYPFIVLGTLPLAFTGGLLFVLIFGLEFSVVVLMGLIILVGVAVNNGIVLIDYINQLREEGYTIREACVTATKTRLRPILMTALTTIFGLIFTAIGLNNGAELLQPLAVTAIGGLLYATILTLVVIPIIYMAFNHRKVKQEEKKEA